MEEDEFKVNIKYEDDGKGKWQSVSARVEVDGDDYYFPAIAGFGETEKEAKEELKDKIIPLLSQVNKLFMAMDESEQLEKFKRLYRKFNPNTMIYFGAYVLYYSANPDSKMDIPSCIYEKVETLYSKWSKRCEMCVYHEDDDEEVWRDTLGPLWNWSSGDYRIKEEPKYVPYENTEELIEDFCKRSGAKRSPMGEPFIWIVRKNGDFIVQIIGFYHGASGDFVGIHSGNSAETLSLEELFYNYTFKDGSTIGKKVE